MFRRSLFCLLLSFFIVACDDGEEIGRVTLEGSPTGHSSQPIAPHAMSFACTTGVEPTTDDPQKIVAWQEFKKESMRTLQTAAGFCEPELLGPEINTLGWEDGAMISRDGTELAMVYAPMDLFGFLFPTAAGGAAGDISKFAIYNKGPERGVSPAYSVDAYVAPIVKNQACQPVRMDFSEDVYSEGSLFETTEGWYYTSNKLLDGDDGDHDDNIFYNGLPLPRSINGPTQQGDPVVVRADNYNNDELYFWQTKTTDQFSSKTIYMSTKSGANWQEPVALAEPINLQATDNFQAFLNDAGELYFASNRQAGRFEIWRSQRLDSNAWSDPQRILWNAEAKADVGAVVFGKPSLTADQAWLYFVVIFKNAAGEWDADIARVRHQGC